jgi:DNA-binding transcriptional LysR family regulator
MQLRALEAFLTVAEMASVTAAAARLGLTQPGLSRQIQKLEEDVGVLLFARSREGLRLTPAGERFRAYAEDVTNRHRQLVEELCGVATPIAGDLKIAASTTPGEFIVPPLVAEFTNLYPDVDARVSIADSEGAIEALRARACDVAFVGAEIEHAGLRFDPIGEDEVLLAVPRTHSFAHERQVSVGALANQRFVEREDGSGTVLSVRRALAQSGWSLPPHRVAMTLSTTQAIVSAVRSGYGIGFVSSLALEGAEATGVASVRLAGVPLRRSLYFVRDERRVMSQVAQRFATLVLDWAATVQRKPVAV